LKLVVPIARENQVRMRVDEAWNDRAAVPVETNRLALDPNVIAEAARRTDVDDAPSM
jgi:hypothetical protein